MGGKIPDVPAQGDVENMTYEELRKLSEKMIRDLQKKCIELAAENGLTKEQEKMVMLLMYEAYFTGMRSCRNFHVWQDANPDAE